MSTGATALKAYFVAGAEPTATQFAELIDGNLNLNDGGTVAGAAKFTGAVNLVKDYESITTATKAVTAADSGTVYGFNRAGGIVVTLPTPAAGLTFTFLVETTFTTAGQIRTATTDGTDGFLGSISIVDTGANAAAADRFNCQPAASNDFIDLGQIEQGWLTGGKITLTGVNATTYFVEGLLMGDGTLETVFQDAA